MYPEPTMIRNRNRFSSPITIISDEDIFADEDVDANSSTESDSSSEKWGWPENQLGLELEDQSYFRRDDQDDEVVALDENGEIEHHEAIPEY
jgi:hypothetical protein